jgi:hypothetical protein
VPDGVAANNLGVAVLLPLQVSDTGGASEGPDDTFADGLFFFRFLVTLYNVDQEDAPLQMGILNWVIEGLIEDDRGVGRMREWLRRCASLDLYFIDN